MASVLTGEPGGNLGVSVIIPCLNEEASLGQVIEAAKTGIAKLGLPGEILVVDNASTDNSARIAKEHGARVITKAERGYGAALRYGFSQAKFDIIVMGDGDLTYDFTRLDYLTRPILEQEVDFVIGHRMRNILPGAMSRLHKYVGNPFFSITLRILFHNSSVKDPNSGMRAITREAYHKLQCVTTGMEFASEMVIRAFHVKLKIVEVDIVYHPRLGHSKLRSFEDGWRHLRFMTLMSPTMMLLVPGSVGWLLGLILLYLQFAYGWAPVGSQNSLIYIMVMAVLLNVVSVQLITIGMLAKAYAHLSGLREDPVVGWFYRWFTIERVTFVGVVLFLAGVTLCTKIFISRASGSMEIMAHFKSLLIGILSIFNGTQIIASAYLFSIMAMQLQSGGHSPSTKAESGISP
jgi:glycosyltransferase involved in cell wall biosynthesis